MGLTEDTAERANGNLGLLRDDGSVDNTAGESNELDVTTFLARFHKASRLKPALDLAKRQRLKPPQPRPQLCGLVALA